MAKSWILGWVRSNEEGVKRRHAIFMLEVRFQLAGSSWLLCDPPGASSPMSYLILCFSYWAVPSYHGWVTWPCLCSAPGRAGGRTGEVGGTGRLCLCCLWVPSDGASSRRARSSPCRACAKGTGRGAREKLVPFLPSSLQGNGGLSLRGPCPRATVPSAGLARSAHGARGLGFLSSKPPEPGCN